MAATPQTPKVMTEAEYLAFERASLLKHEYIGGEVFAMTGASEAQSLISVNLIASLKNQLRGRPCKVYPGHMRLKIEVTGLYTYPDISVVCGEARFADAAFDTLLNPTLIIEILSPSTERHDRGRKFQGYRLLASLQEAAGICADRAGQPAHRALCAPGGRQMGTYRHQRPGCQHSADLHRLYAHAGRGVRAGGLWHRRRQHDGQVSIP